MDFLTDFGVKPILLVAQVVNFLILLFILKRFLYKPILKVLETRKEKIAQGLKDAEEIEKRLQQVTAEREEKLKVAGTDAEKILQEATKTAEKIVTAAHEKASADIEKMIEKSEDSMRLERAKMQQEMKTELVDLVVLTLEKVTGQVISEKDQKTLVKKSIKNIK